MARFLDAYAHIHNDIYDEMTLDTQEVCVFSTGIHIYINEIYLCMYVCVNICIYIYICVG